MNQISKLVFSRTLSGPLEWESATLAQGDPAEEVAALKAQPGGEIGLAGSISLAQEPVFGGFDQTRLRLVRARSSTRAWSRSSTSSRDRSITEGDSP